MEKIIIVDDESLIRYSLASVFRGPQAEVFSVGTGKAALDVAQNHHLDLCFLDVHLPDMNGLDIMRTLRDISPWTRIVIMTGSELTDAEMSSLRENAHCLMSKPFDLDQVGSTSDRLLCAHGSPDEVQGAEKSTAESCILWIARDTRKHPRRPMTETLTGYATVPHGAAEPSRITADTLNISESGLCIVTASELKPGHLVRFPLAPVMGSSVVRWCLPSGAVGTYRAGIQFVAPENLPAIARPMDAAPSNGSTRDHLPA